MSGVDISGGDGAVRYDTVTDLLWNNNKMTFDMGKNIFR